MEKRAMEQLCNISVVKQVLARHHFQFSKSLGQNFLMFVL